MAIGDKRIEDPLPTLSGSSEPAKGSPVFRNRYNIRRVVIPISKRDPPKESLRISK
jgi:hypothetical protein